MNIVESNAKSYHAPGSISTSDTLENLFFAPQLLIQLSFEVLNGGDPEPYSAISTDFRPNTPLGE